MTCLPIHQLMAIDCFHLGAVMINAFKNAHMQVFSMYFHYSWVNNKEFNCWAIR